MCLHTAVVAEGPLRWLAIDTRYVGCGTHDDATRDSRRDVQTGVDEQVALLDDSAVLLER